MTYDLPSRSDYHWPRRLFHICAGLIVVGLVFVLETKERVLWVAGVSCFAFIAFELLRVQWSFLREKVAHYGRPLMRQGEETQVSGMPFFVIGVLVSFVVFPLPIAVMAILFLSIGDPTASLVGCYFRKSNRQVEFIEGKSLQGTLACSLVCFCLSLGFGDILFGLEWGNLQLWLFALAGALAAGIAELLPLRTDDNLSMPIISGALLWFYASVMQITPGLVLP